MRRLISLCQASSAPGSGSDSTLSRSSGKGDSLVRRQNNGVSGDNVERHEHEGMVDVIGKYVEAMQPQSASPETCSPVLYVMETDLPSDSVCRRP